MDIFERGCCFRMRTEKCKGATGGEVVRFDDNKSYDESWTEAEKCIDEGKPICLSDLMIKAGM